MAGPSEAKRPDIAAIVLAGGSSSRFGADNKLLAVVEGVPLVRRVAERMLQSRAGRVTVVTGHDRQAVEAAVSGLDVALVHNPRHAEGMSTTVAAGVSSLGTDVRAAVITPGDLPDLSPALVDRLIAEFERTGGDRIVIPVLPTGEQRNPVVWPRRFFGELSALSGDTGARGLIRQHAGEVVRIVVDAIEQFADIDRPEDLASWRQRHEEPLK